MRPLQHLAKPSETGRLARAPILFCAQPEQPAESSLPAPTTRQNPSKTQAKTPAPKKPWLRWFLGLSPICNLVGGTCLISGGLMSWWNGTPKEPATQAQAAPTAQLASANEAGAAPIDAATRSDWDTLQKTLTQTGWTLTSISSLAGMFNGMTLSYVSKQPGMMLSSILSLGICPILMFDPNITVRSAMLFLGGPWLAGLANKYKNDRLALQGSQAEAPLEFDMAPLIHWNKLAETDPNSAQKSKLHLWFRYLGKGLVFIGEDQVRLVTALKHSIQDLFTSSTAPQFVSDNPAALPTASSEAQSRVGAALIMMGSVPMLLMGGDSAAVNAVCSKLVGLGGFLGDSALFFRAVRERDGKLMVGIPVRNLGNAWFHTDIGAGASYVGRVAIQYTFINDVLKAQAAALQAPKPPAKAAP